MFNAKILCDSVNPAGNRITTVELTYPRCIHSEFMTHRMFSRNSASSRAIPVKKMIEQVENNPFIPIHWGKNQKGMQAWEELPIGMQEACKREWLFTRDECVNSVRNMIDDGLHKQIANRLLEPWMWITVIATGNSTAYENFFKLRCHKDAEPHTQKIAYMLRDEYDKSKPNKLVWGDTHTPLIQEDEQHLPFYDMMKISVGRCARVSYLTHDGKRDIQADIGLHDRLKDAGHWSPFEHVATTSKDGNGGNLGEGWHQYRKEFLSEVCHKAERD